MPKKKVVAKEPAIDDDLRDDNDRAQAIHEFTALSRSRGWKRIKDYYEHKIEFHKEQLRTSEITSIDELERLRAKINMCEQFKNLPDILVMTLEGSEQKQDFDPYYKAEEL